LSEEENRTVYDKCANPNGHGHNYILEVTLSGEPEQSTGMIFNLTDLKTAINQAIIQWVDHKHLNYDVPWLAEVIPTTEILALKFWERLTSVLPAGLLYEVKLYETENNSASYRGEAHA
jgi:6-pyruvoyltetrahydropterin/6-carboxytetrahydropterin synthase